jgi:hypothetical protein
MPGRRGFGLPFKAERLIEILGAGIGTGIRYRDRSDTVRRVQQFVIMARYF